MLIQQIQSEVEKRPHSTSTLPFSIMKILQNSVSFRIHPQVLPLPASHRGSHILSSATFCPPPSSSLLHPPQACPMRNPLRPAGKTQSRQFLVVTPERGERGPARRRLPSGNPGPNRWRPRGEGRGRRCFCGGICPSRAGSCCIKL